MSSYPNASRNATAAMLAAVFMIGHQVAAKAVRDALFLSSFDVTALPTMLIAASLLAIVSVVMTSRVMTRFGPASLIPPAFVLSAGLMILEWQLVLYSPRIGAVTVYAHIAAFGSILISGFWSLVNEHFDPRTAKRLIGRIGTGGTLGGLIGGLLAARAADAISVPTMIPLLAVMHMICALILLRLRTGDSLGTAARSPGAEVTPYRSGARVLREQPYLQCLGLLVLAGTVSATLLDYVFKARASEYVTEAGGLMRLFAIYYAAIGLGSVIIQSSLSRLSLRKLGLAKTVGTLPTVVALGSFGVVVVPSLLATALARGAEAIFRNSLFRSAYEVLYTPVPREEKRAAKGIIDVGFERVGDAVGGGVTRLILLVGAQAQVLMMIFSLILALLGLYIAKRLHYGYVRALEQSLMAKALELDIREIDDKTTRQTAMLTMGTLRLDSSQSLFTHQQFGIRASDPDSRTPARFDPMWEKVGELLSGEPERIRKILRSNQPLEPLLIPLVISLLARDEMVRDAIKSLRCVAENHTGQLVDALLDYEQPFSIRRRVPRILSAAPTQRAAEGLLAGLSDQSFEVRFQCSKALSHICDRNPNLQLDSEEVLAAAAREVKVDRQVWQGHQLLDPFEEKGEVTVFEDNFLQKRVSRSLEHVFTVLSLTLPKEPLRIAYRGLHTQDTILRGTALEYLETILPESIRSDLWPFLEDDREKKPVTKSREQILDELMKSNKSIELSLRKIRKGGH